ncbi:AAA family ATPase [Streptosporangiaceae bacterium NEAU-GS5]|nr:AAA family ATPase [Streptosporangiaceae bacterium NEAU-GS5]
MVDRADVRVRLLGPVDVTVDDVIRPVPGLRGKAVLATLALRQGEVVHADRLIEIVWDGQPPATAVNTLQRHVSYLRRVLGSPGAITARAPGYLLNLDGEATDARLAERLIRDGRAVGDPAQRVVLLERALRLWRGPTLADVIDLSWFREESDRLERLRGSAEQSRVEAVLALGGHAEVAPELADLAERNPFDEDLHRLLMIALYRSGRQADALSTYQRLRERLREELGIDPSGPLRELETAILRQDPALTHAAMPPAAPAEARADLSPEPSLVERTTEMARIDHALDRATTRRAGSVLIFEGPGGIGKTSMLEYARAQADRLGFTAATARGGELEVEYAWGCARQLFERFIKEAAPATAAFLRGSEADDLPRGEYPIINSLFWLVSDLAARNPLLMVLDDLHWADLPSVRFLAYLAARLDDLPTVVMVALRPRSERVEHTVSVIAGLPHSVTCPLQPLTAAGSADLLTTLIDAQPDPQMVARCHEATRGNPFLLRELGRELGPELGHELTTATQAHSTTSPPTTPPTTAIPTPVTTPPAAPAAAPPTTPPNTPPTAPPTTPAQPPSTPLATTPTPMPGAVPGAIPGAMAARMAIQMPESSPSIARFVGRQLRSLPESATRVANALAVLGDDVGSAELADVLRTSQQDVLDTLSVLTAGALVSARGVPARFSFAHSLIRAAVYDAMPSGARADLHLRAVDATMRDHDPVKAATHLLRVPPGMAVPPQMGGHDAVAILGQATDVSLFRASVDGAVAFLRRMLEEDLGDRRLGVLTRLGMTEALVDTARAIDHLSHALALEPEPEARAQIAFVLASTQWLVGRPREAAMVCQAALERERGVSASARFALQACIGMVATGTRHGRDLVDLFDSFRDQTPDSSVGGLLFEATLALRDMFANDRASAERRAQRVVSDERLVGDALGEPTLTCAWYALVACDHPSLLPAVEAMLDYSRTTGSLRSAAPAYSFRSAYMLSRGHLDEAVRDAQVAWQVSESSGVELGLSFIGEWLMIALVARGDIGTAAHILDQVKAIHGPGLSRTIYATGETEVLLAQGHIQQAYEAALSIRDDCRTQRILNPAVSEWMGPLVRCLVQFGRLDEAQAVAQEMHAAAQTWGTPRVTGRALRLMAATESRERGLELLAESVRLLEHTDARLEHANARYAFGDALRRADRDADARTHLQIAVDLARYCGARPLQHRAATALRMAGGHMAPPTTDSATALTPTEQQVADLAIRGLSDREIAETLYLSVGGVRDLRETVARKQP